MRNPPTALPVGETDPWRLISIDEIDLVKDAEGASPLKNKQAAANKEAALAASKAILQGGDAVDEGLLTMPLPDGHFAKEMQGCINSALAGFVAEGQPAEQVAGMRRLGAVLLQQGLRRETFNRADKASTRISSLTKQVANKAPGFEQSPSKLRHVSRLLPDPTLGEGVEGVRKDLTDLFGQVKPKLSSAAASEDINSLADVLMHFYNSRGGGMFAPKKQMTAPGKVLAASINHAAQKHLQMVHAALARRDYTLAVELLLAMCDFDKDVGELNSIAQAVGDDAANSLYLSRRKLHGVGDEQWELVAGLASNKEFREMFTKWHCLNPRPRAAAPLQSTTQLQTAAQTVTPRLARNHATHSPQCAVGAASRVTTSQSATASSTL